MTVPNEYCCTDPRHLCNECKEDKAMWEALEYVRNHRKAGDDVDLMDVMDRFFPNEDDEDDDALLIAPVLNFEGEVTSKKKGRGFWDLFDELDSKRYDHDESRTLNSSEDDELLVMPSLFE